jgi:hypothetical protein
MDTLGRAKLATATRIAVGLTLLAATLAGCGSGHHDVDTQAWRAELADQGLTVRDWATYQSVYEDECKKSTADLAIFLTLSGAPSKEEMRTGFSYQCPDQMDKLNNAYAQIEDATSSVNDACSTPKSERTEEQQQLVEAVGC